MAKDFFNEIELKEIRNAIESAENESSGEIRLHLESRCKEDVLDRAAYIFEKLEMHKTELRNGVLFYLAVKDRQFAILGDAGINKLVPDNFWDEVKDQMQALFKSGEFKKALVEGILMSGSKLKEHFSLSKDDQNELSDEISFGS